MAGIVRRLWQQPLRTPPAWRFALSSCRRSTTSTPLNHYASRSYSTYKPTRELPDADVEVYENMRARKLDKWGWVIYRTSYQDQATWERFKEYLDQADREYLSTSKAPQLLDFRELTYFDDESLFNNASRPALREHFKKWRQEALPREQPRMDFTWPVWETRYELFFQVDDETMETFKKHASEHLSPYDERVRMKVIQADFKREEDMEDYWEEGFGEDMEEIDGTKGEEVGWMYTVPGGVGHNFYEYLGEEYCWHRFYVRPPGVCIY
ncbi:hypothetical protein BDZ85DRAFT_255412 [Elsinoe ampelina]|uniref:Uncharacterized protein n=1 Tax=Elsinoe ampelina TaxID=302913 RepID=A0A6A6GQV9_9PEZI|nr:hypothetical protein BDZ85DRAFT_255412 [Elsinoe ampelina]